MTYVFGGGSIFSSERVPESIGIKVRIAKSSPSEMLDSKKREKKIQKKKKKWRDKKGKKGEESRSKSREGATQALESLHI